MAIQYSIQKMVSDGTLSTIVLGIQYLQRNDMHIRIDGVEIPQSGSSTGYTWSFIDNTTLRILPVVPSGIEVLVFRRTDVDTMYNVYSQNAQFDEATIDENNQQLLYIAQEYLEQGIPGAGVDTVELVREDGALLYYRIRLTDGSYTPEFVIPRATAFVPNPAVFTFTTGGTLSVDDGDLAVLWPMFEGGDGQYYTWRGAYPKTIPAASSPMSTGGVSSSGWLPLGDVTLREDLASTIPGRGVDLVGGAAKKSEVDALSTEFYQSNISSVFSQKMQLAFEDVYVLLQGDSTGDADDEWYRLMVGLLAPMYPTHSFLYKKWSGSAWGTTQTISTGTSSRTVTFYNGSVGGATPGYWAGNRKTLAYDGKTFDVIFTSYGLNVPTQYNAQAERHTEQLITLRADHPDARIISCIQPVDYNLMERSALRGRAQRFVNSSYGIKTMDVMRLFLDLVKSTGGNYTPWYSDGLHPSPSGSAKWAQLATSVIQTDKSDFNSIIGPRYSNPALPNSKFSSFLSGASNAPDFFVTNGAAVTKDTTVYETAGQSVKVFGVSGSVGVIFSSLSNEIVKRFQHLPYFVIAARVWSNSPSETGGKVFFAHSVSSAYTEISSTQAPSTDVDGGFRWSILKVDKEWYRGKSDFRLGVYGGTGTTQYTYVDRIIISPSIVIDDSVGEGYRYSLDAAVAGFTMTAGQRTFRNVSDANARPGMNFSAALYPSAGDITLSAHCNTNGVVTVEFSNSSAGGVAIPNAVIRLFVDSQ